jgi:hypothetical protein
LKTLDLGKTSALRFENVKFFKKPALYALKTLNFKLTLPSLASMKGKNSSVPFCIKNIPDKIILNLRI